jgi:hypothetical protein
MAGVLGMYGMIIAILLKGNRKYRLFSNKPPTFNPGRFL